MATGSGGNTQGWLLAPIDRMDIAVGVVVGITTTVLKLIAYGMPDWRFGAIDSLVASLITIVYILYRARREPEKLDEWGITSPISLAALAVGAALLVLGVASLAGIALILGGQVAFEMWFLPRMIDYILGAFPQQFFMCSVGLVTLSKLRSLQGAWRIPLAVGIVFGLAHFWTPAHIPGTLIPIQVIGTFPMGFLAAWYFLRFRTIVPLTIIHAIMYIFLSQWVEAHL